MQISLCVNGWLLSSHKNNFFAEHSACGKKTTKSFEIRAKMIKNSFFGSVS